MIPISLIIIWVLYVANKVNVSKKHVPRVVASFFICYQIERYHIIIIMIYYIEHYASIMEIIGQWIFITIYSFVTVIEVIYRISPTRSKIHNSIRNLPDHFSTPSSIFLSSTRSSAMPGSVNSIGSKR